MVYRSKCSRRPWQRSATRVSICRICTSPRDASVDRRNRPAAASKTHILTDKAAAEARRQEALRAAHETFNRAYLSDKTCRAAEYECALARWDAVKSNPQTKGYVSGTANDNGRPRPACFWQLL
jgi:hypothetical protein